MLSGRIAIVGPARLKREPGPTAALIAVHQAPLARLAGASQSTLAVAQAIVRPVAAAAAAASAASAAAAEAILAAAAEALAAVQLKQLCQRCRALIGHILRLHLLHRPQHSLQQCILTISLLLHLTR